MTKYLVYRKKSDLEVVIRKKGESVIIYNTKGNAIHKNFPVLTNSIKEYPKDNFLAIGYLPEDVPDVYCSYLGNSFCLGPEVYISEIKYHKKKLTSLSFEKRQSKFLEFEDSKYLKFVDREIISSEESFDEFFKDKKGQYTIINIGTNERFFYRPDNNDKQLYEDPIDFEDVYINYPEEEKKLKYVIQGHTIGERAHLDLRMETGKGYLIGWTIDAINSIPEDPGEDHALAEELIMKAWQETKEKLKDYKEKFRCQKKSKIPQEWLDKEGTIKPGEPGASKEEYGHLFILGSGKIEWGTQKKDFHSYFLDGEEIKGRFYFTKLEEGEDWMGAMAKSDNRPYVISKRAVKKAWMPPKGKSALPSSVKEEIPDKYKFWKKEDSIEIRDNLVNAISNGDVDINYDFSLIKKYLLSDKEDEKLREDLKITIARYSDVLNGNASDASKKPLQEIFNKIASELKNRELKIKEGESEASKQLINCWKNQNCN